MMYYYVILNLPVPFGQDFFRNLCLLYSYLAKSNGEIKHLLLLVRTPTRGRVNVKLSGFSYIEHGMLRGRVISVSKVPDGKDYIAEIFLVDGMKSSYTHYLKFIQEMDGTADIITHDTRLINRFIGPLRAVMGQRM